MSEAIPQALRDARQWVCWKLIDRKDGKPGKKPFRPWGPRPAAAKSNQPATWGTYEQAVTHAANGGGFDGVGLMFAGELVGIDLDGVVTDDGTVEPWAMQIVEQVASYTEYSPSGRGLHILALGKLPAGRRRRGQVEMYDATSPRFFTMTGRVLAPYTELHARQDAITAVHAAHLGADDGDDGAAGTAVPDDLLQKALRSNGNMARLWHGDLADFDGDHSRADLALCRHLAFWTRKDAAAIDACFRQSGLMREKWDHKHGAMTYGQMTIQKAVSSTQRIYEPPRPAGTQNGRQAPEIDVRNPKTADFWKAFEKLSYEFRQNALNDDIEINGEPINEGLEARLRNRMRDLGLTSVTRIDDAYKELAYMNRYNPLVDYLDSLEWDGADTIGRLVNEYMHETTGFGETAWKRWLIGSVAKIYESAQNFMLVIDGPQGIGKSRFVRWLCPLPGFFVEGPIKPDDKDYLLRMATSWIWEVAELQSTTRKADREALKGMLTMQTVTLRKAYAKYDISKPSMASFVGTINEDGSGFLSDSTGNRRFVIIRIDKFMWGYTDDIDPAQVWAQAVALYRQGEPWELTKEEQYVRDAINEEYEMNNVVAVSFFEHFDVDPSKTDEFTTIHDIMRTLREDGLTGNQQFLLSELSRLLKRMGAQPFRARVGNSRPTAYRGVFVRKAKDTVGG